MDFRKIEYFVKVAEYLNFSNAAEQIPMSHQGLSKQIRLLEQELGASLFERSTVKVSLTDVGKKLYESFRPIVDEAYHSYEIIEDYIKLRKSMLVVGYFNALSFQQIVNPVLEYIKKKQPELGIDVYATDVGDAKERFIKDKIDLLITVMIDPEEWKTVTYYSIKTFPLKIIVSSKHPWYGRQEITEAELEESSLLYYRSGSAAFMKNLKVKDRISMHNYDSYMSRLSEGMEFGVVADIYSRREGEFCLIDLPDRCKCDADIIVAFKIEHPLSEFLNQLGSQWTSSD